MHAVEHFVDREDLFDAIEAELRVDMQVVDGVGERMNGPVDEELHVAAVQRDRRELQVVGRESESAAQIEIERNVVLDAHAQQRCVRGAAVQIFGERDFDVRRQVLRIRGDVVLAVDESNAPPRTASVPMSR